MNALLLTLTIGLMVYVSVSYAQVNSGEYRSSRIRLSPASLHRRFTLTKNPVSSSSMPRRRLVRRRRPLGGRPLGGDSQSRLGPASALRAGEEGSYDFADQYNVISPDRNAGKPTKNTAPETSNPNKINIESQIAVDSAEDNAVVENVYVGETAIVHCTFDNSDQLGAFRQAKIWWTKLSERDVDRPVILAAGTQVRIPDDRLRVVTFPDNSFSILIIKNALPEDAGRYKCSLPTITGTETSFTTLQVKEAKSDHIAISPKDTSLNSGDELNLFCQPDDPTLNVWWTAKDSTGNNIDVTRGFDRVAGKTLTIQNIQRNQAGVYTCHVELGFGSPIRRHFTVLVKERPWPIDAYIAGFKINSLLASYNRDPVYGDNVNLRCDTGGVPTPTVSWYKDGRLLGDSYKYTITSYEPSYKYNSVISKLIITSFQRYDEGRYMCKAVNDAGSQEQVFDITGKTDSDSLAIPSDDEDIATAALKGRRGQLQVSICKAGMPCRSNLAFSRRAQTDSRQYSGDGE